MSIHNPQEFKDLIREKLPELLRRRPEFRYEIVGIMAETLATRDELAAMLKKMDEQQAEANRRFEALERRFEESNRRFDALLAELRRHREETAQRFEAMDHRFEAVDRRFEAVIADLRDLRLEVSPLSGRLGRGMEEIVRQTVERFSGEKFTEVRRLVLKDEEGELYGVPAEVEFDLYLGGTVSYVVEVKSHFKTGDVLNFYRKKVFAEARLGGPLKGLLISASIDRSAKKKCQELGLEVIARSAV